VWWLLARAAYRGEFQYRANFLMGVLGGLVYQGSSLAVIGVVLARFGSIGGWGLPEVAFLYGMRLTAHALFMVPFAQLAQVDHVVREGEFDRYLTRPAGLLTQVITRRSSTMAVGDLIGGVAVLAVAVGRVPVHWTVPAVGYLVLAVVGGAMVEGAFHVGGSALVFRLLSTFHLKLIFDMTFNTFGNYPMRIFRGGVRFGLTFAFPLAFVAYLPATVLLDRTGELSVPRWLALGAPLVGALLFAAAYRFWRHQTRYYTSSGH
jgi:ABC-2 type transport system permease protein